MLRILNTIKIYSDMLNHQFHLVRVVCMSRSSSHILISFLSQSTILVEYSAGTKCFYFLADRERACIIRCGSLLFRVDSKPTGRNMVRILHRSPPQPLLGSTRRLYHTIWSSDSIANHWIVISAASIGCPSRQV